MRFNLTTTGLKHYKELLERRVAAFKIEVADMIYKWQVPPAGEDFGDKDKHPYFSGYFRANWQVSINGQSTPEIPGELRPSRWSNGSLEEPDTDAVMDSFRSDINPEKLREFLGDKADADILKSPIVIYNPTWYGPWLNDGGYNVETVLGNWRPGKRTKYGSFLYHTPPPGSDGGGSDFMRKCMDYMHGQDFGAIAKRIRIEYSQYYRHGS